MITVSFGSVWGIDAFSAEQEQNISILSLVEEKVLDVFEKIEEKTNNKEIDAQLIENKKEIEVLIEKQQQAIEETTNVEQVKEIMQETKERIILKTYDAITDHDPMSDSIRVPWWYLEQQEAVEVALEQIVEDTVITIQIRTDSSLEQVKQSFIKYDDIIIKELFSRDGIYYIEVSFTKEWLIAQELFSKLDEGNLPDFILWYQVIKPEVYTIGQIDLWAEQITNIRGVQRFQSSLYIESLRNPTLPKIHVGVIDTWIDPTHPDLIGALSQTIPWYDFVNDDADPMDDHQHGTHVAGTIAAQVNGSGVLGINPAIKLVPLKICTKTGYCPSYAITNAIRYAADHGIEVLNMSLGGAWTLVNNPTCAALAYAAELWSIAVVAAGNANTNAIGFIPAACPHTITVSAVDSNLKRASFSNYGTEANISAPGVGIYSTVLWGKWWFLDGTSMATPHISAAVATVHAVAWPMSTSDMQTKLLTHTLPVTYESGKPVWPLLDYPSLMQSLGIQPTQVTCGTNPCFWNTIWSGVIAVAQQISTWVTVQSNPIPLTQNWLTISYSSVWLRVKEQLILTIEWGKNGYTFIKWSENFWLGDRVNTTVATSEWNKIKTTISLLGLQPGTTELIIKDNYTNKQIVLPITISKHIMLINVGQKIWLYNGNFWKLWTITFSWNNWHLVRTQDWWAFYQEYTAKKSGIIQMTVAISNSYENKTQYMLYEIRSTTTPITASTSLLSLKVGQHANEINIGGWAPPYTVKKWSTNLWFWMRSSDITLASADTGQSVTFDESETTSIALSISWAVTVPCNEGACENTELVDPWVEIIDLFSPQTTQNDSVEIANVVFNFAVLPLSPGISSVTVIDADGSTLTIPVRIDPAELAIKLNRQVGWYYINTSYDYEIKSVTSSHPGIVAVTYSSKTYIATAKSNGYATLTFSIFNKTEQRNQIMQIHVIAGSPEPLQLTGAKSEVTVGETIELQIKGGMWPYKITKTNEWVALGFGSDTAPISVAWGTMKQVASIQLPQKGDPIPVPKLDTLSWLILTWSNGTIVNLIDPEELNESEEITVQGIRAVWTPITVEWIHTIRVLWLQSGTTTLTVTDADWLVQQLPVTVTPRHIMIDATDNKTVLTSTTNYPGRWDISKITSSTPSVNTWTQRWSVFLKWFYIASGTLTIDIYNRHESKKQTLVYTTEVIWPTYEQYQQAVAEAFARAAAALAWWGKQSSITAADLIAAGLDPCYSVRSCSNYRENTNPGSGPIPEKQIADDKSIVAVPTSSFSMNAWQMTVINVTRHSTNTLTPQYDATKLIVKKYTGPGKLQATAYISETDTGSTDERFGSEIYEVVDAPSDMYILNNWLPDGKVLYEQYIVMGKPWKNDLVFFSSKYNKKMQIDIYYADKIYTLNKWKVVTSKLNGMPLVSAYEDNSSIVDNRAYFEFKDSKWLPISTSLNDSITVQAKNYGQTVLHREFQQSPTQLQVLDIKVKVPDPNIPTFSKSISSQVIQVGEEHWFAFSSAWNYRIYYNTTFVSVEDSWLPIMQYAWTRQVNWCPETYADSMWTTTYVPLKLLSSVSTIICLENKDTWEIVQVPLISSIIADGWVCTSDSSTQCMMYPYNLFTVYDSNGSIVTPWNTPLSQSITYFFVHWDNAYRSRIVWVPATQLTTFLIDVWEWVINGDYQTNPNAANIIWQIGFGFTPAWFAWDIRDLSYQLGNGTKFGIIMAWFAFIPGAGDGAKALWQSGKYGDEVLKIWNLKFTNTTYQHMLDVARQIPTQVLEQIIQWTRYADPGWSSAWAYYWIMTKNNNNYNVKVIYDEMNNKILHFHYTTDAVWPLPNIN
jgi:Subtilase family